MAVRPSCVAFVVHDDDAFRTQLIKTMDQEHFTVTFKPDGNDAIALLQERQYEVVVLGLDVKTRRGVTVLDYLRDHRENMRCGILIIGEPDPALRTFAPWADEMLQKPVDAAYVAQRARTYCHCAN